MIKIILTMAVALLLSTACMSEPTAEEVYKDSIEQANLYADFTGGKVVRCVPEQKRTRYDSISCLVRVAGEHNAYSGHTVTSYMITCDPFRCRIDHKRKYEVYPKESSR